MEADKLIEELNKEIKRVKIQRNDIEQDLIKAWRKINHYKNLSQEYHAELQKLKTSQLKQ